MQRDIFISYSRRDFDFVKEIKGEIEKTIGVQCWMDLYGIESGSPRFTKDIVEGINNSKVFLFMLSSHSQGSKFALRELNYAYNKKDTLGIHVVIVNIDNCRLIDEFEFMYGLTDAILWTDTSQHDKLIKDLRTWTGSIDKAEAAMKAKEYLLNQKERKALYSFTGSTNHGIGEETELYLTYDFTQAEIDHFTRLFIDLYNEDAQSENDKAETLDDVVDDIGLMEFEGSNPELDKLFDRCRGDGMAILNYFSKTPCYFYNFSYISWNPVEMEISNRCKFKVELTDEEYVYLLTEQLAARRDFTFNSLMIINPQLAIKIANSVARYAATSNHVPQKDKWGYNYEVYNANTFMIIFDEVIADIETMQGPLSYSKQLYYTGYSVDYDNWKCAYVATEGRQMYLLEGKQPHTTSLIYAEIDADAVMKRLKAVDYPDMLNKLKDRYHTSTALEDIKSWFDAEGITYKKVGN